jgi:hypothetical protein
VSADWCPGYGESREDVLLVKVYPVSSESPVPSVFKAFRGSASTRYTNPEIAHSPAAEAGDGKTSRYRQPIRFRNSVMCAT